MPIYEYRCEDCGHHGEELQPVGAKALRKCPECGGRYRRQVSAPAFQFKGSGWYVTDYARNSTAKEGAEEKSSKADSAKADAADKGAAKKEKSGGEKAKKAASEG